MFFSFICAHINAMIWTSFAIYLGLDKKAQEIHELDLVEYQNEIDIQDDRNVPIGGNLARYLSPLDICDMCGFPSYNVYL